VDWESVYEEQLPRIYNYFRYRVGDDALAEDLTSATFEKAWRRRGQYRNDLSAFSTWLFTIARNVARDNFRRARGNLPLENVPLPADEHDPEHHAQQRFDTARLTQLLDQLPPRERELVAMKYGAELTNRAIAKLTGLSESNVGTILHRVIRKLRAAWEKET
jgi:RNA polymerase sigma-70 factor (ECF subfamily)